MAVDINSVARNAQMPEVVSRTQERESSRQAEQTAENRAAALNQKSTEPDPAKYLQDILNFTQFYDKRLKFSFNKQLNEVVVKVIDSKTDKVIKEIPPEAIQRLQLRIREALGLLINELI